MSKPQSNEDRGLTYTIIITITWNAFRHNLKLHLALSQLFSWAIVNLVLWDYNRNVFLLLKTSKWRKGHCGSLWQNHDRKRSFTWGRICKNIATFWVGSLEIRLVFSSSYTYHIYLFFSNRWQTNECLDRMRYWRWKMKILLFCP